MAGLLPLPRMCGVRCPLEPEVFDVGAAGLGDTETVQAEQHGQRGVVAVELLGGKQEGAELPTVHPVALACRHLWSADVLGRVRRDASVDGERTDREAAHRGEPPVDRRQPVAWENAAMSLSANDQTSDQKRLFKAGDVVRHADTRIGVVVLWSRPTLREFLSVLSG